MADSALITSDILAYLAQGGYRFVSRLPDTFSYATVARSEALYGPADKWQDIGKLAPEKHASLYEVREVVGEIEERDYRLIVVRSSRLFDLNGKTLARKAEKEHEAIRWAGRKIWRETWSCPRGRRSGAADAAGPVGAELLDHGAPCRGSGDPAATPRGRPTKVDVPPAGVTVYRIHPASWTPTPSNARAAREQVKKAF